MARKRTIRFDAKFTDEQAIKAYAEYGSFARAALELGVDISSLRCRLAMLDVPKTPTIRQPPALKRSKRALYQQRIRDRNREARRCLNEQKYKPHAVPSVNPKTALPWSKCDDCREIHKKGSK